MPTSSTTVDIQIDVPETMAGKRLDQAASELISDYSRSRLQQWIKEGALRVNGQQKRPRDKLFGGESLHVNVELVAEGRWEAETNVEFDVVHEDESLIVINKPAGLVVHPAAGNAGGTLLNGLLNQWPELEQVPRAGIVHRLDKETTGLMVVARNLQSHTSLVRQLQKRRMGREYEAVALGVMTGGGMVDAPLGRHPRSRTKMAVLALGGKDAITHYRVINRFKHHTHIRVKLETGRTHQIRVHMAHIGYPLVGDSTYGGRFRIPRGASEDCLDMLRGFKRQALHAAELTLLHPARKEEVSWEAPIPEDMQQLIAVLAEEHRQQDD